MIGHLAYGPLPYFFAMVTAKDNIYRKEYKPLITEKRLTKTQIDIEQEIMKSLTFIILSFINIGSLYSQTNIVNNVISYKLPKGTEMLTKLTLQSSEISKSKFSFISGMNVGQTFEIDNSLIY